MMPTPRLTAAGWLSLFLLDNEVTLSQDYHKPLPPCVCFWREECTHCLTLPGIAHRGCPGIAVAGEVHKWHVREAADSGDSKRWKKCVFCISHNNIHVSLFHSKHPAFSLSEA